jgi:hypothetical protein
MISFDIHVNGSRVCRAGVGPRGVLHACAGWVHGPKGDPRSGTRRRERLSLDVGGMAFRGADDYEHFSWRRRRLRPDDQVTIRVVEARSADPAASRKRERSATSMKVALVLLREAEDMLRSVPGQRAKPLRGELNRLLQRHDRRQVPRGRITRR